jgi:hypothetical protein
MRLMSIKELGAANRSFIKERRLWPPASIFASSLLESKLNASTSEDGA